MSLIMLEELEDAPDAIAARLEAARKALGLSKREFARRSGMEEQTYGAFENGTRSLSLIAAKKIRKAHSIPLEFMYFGKILDLPHRIVAKL
jgi:transcriptional regulator with XRE-family HTH domain